MHHEASFDGDARSLVQSLLEGYQPAWGLGAMCVSIYDTAWVACVTKTVSGVTQWLFPSSFQYVLEAQSSSGAWPAHAGSHHVENTEDSILSTMAALYCLQLHLRNPHQLAKWHSSADLHHRVEKGTAALSQMLHAWRVTECKAVGFEILAPALLDLLEEERGPLWFPDRKALLAVRDKKLSKITPKMLYGKAPFTLLHSLEAFYGRADFDFDRVSHHKVGGSMMASPSSTAAFLMRRSVWDDEAEAYLRLVIFNGDGRGSGAVPSAYPSTNFELTWVMSTTLEAGIWQPPSSDPLSQKVLDILAETRRLNEGLVGFAPGISPDMDDSAKASMIYSQLGHRGFSRQIVERFDSPRCLKTYDSERNPSLSANCNGLLALLLDSDDFPQKAATIEKVTRFICRTWLSAGGELEDKWNLSPHYPAMLMAEAFAVLLGQWDSGNLPGLPVTLLRGEVLLAAFQCLVGTLHSQKMDGSWGVIGSREETCYAIITLANLQTLPLAVYFRPQIISAIERGRSFLRVPSSQLEYLWIEKVTYRSSNITLAYLYSALNISTNRSTLGQKTRDLCEVTTLADFASAVDGDKQLKGPRWLLFASWIESELYIPLLRNYHNGQLKPQILRKDQNIADYVAFNFVLANHRSHLKISTYILCSMIAAALTVQNVDDIMAAQQRDVQSTADIFTLKKIINAFTGHSPSVDVIQLP